MSPLLTTDQLRLLDLLLASGSVTEAAQELGLSQPSVSIQLRKLREQLGDPLFVRSGNRLAPTARAQAMVAPLAEALAALSRVTQPPANFDPATSLRIFRLAMTDASQITLLPRLLARLRERAPRLTLEIGLIGPSLEADLRDDRIDLAFGYLPMLRRGVMRQRLYRQDWVCLTGQAWAEDAALGLREYRSARHVEVASGTGSALLDTALRLAGIERGVALRVPGFLGLAGVMAGSDLVATLPRHTGRTLVASSNLRLRECPFEIEPFSVSQYWHERNTVDPAHKWLRETCHALFDADYVVTGWPAES